jgi:hypothetical protein
VCIGNFSYQISKYFTKKLVGYRVLKKGDSLARVKCGTER